MLASLADAPLDDPHLVYEPKYDGIRALIEVTPGTKTKPAVARIWSRNGNEKTNQFPAIAHAFEAGAAKLPGRVVLDGEIVALDEQGRPAGFQRLQGRMHLLGAREVERAEHDQPAVFIAFDVLMIGKEDLTKLPLVKRRKRLENLSREGAIAEVKVIELENQTRRQNALIQAYRQDLLTRGGLEKKPYPSLEGVRNVQRLMLSSNPRVGEIKLEEIVDRSFVRKLDDSGFIDRVFAAAGVR